MSDGWGTMDDTSECCVPVVLVETVGLPLSEDLLRVNTSLNFSTITWYLTITSPGCLGGKIHKLDSLLSYPYHKIPINRSYTTRRPYVSSDLIRCNISHTPMIPDVTVSCLLLFCSVKSFFTTGLQLLSTLFSLFFLLTQFLLWFKILKFEPTNSVTTTII